MHKNQKDPLTLPIARPLLATFFLCTPLLASAAPLSLDQVLQQAGDGGGSAAANAELQARYAATEQRDSEAGWEMFGSANAGKYRELVTEDLVNDYYGRSYAIGVRYPLLGAMQRRVQAVRAADRDAHLGEIEQGLQRARQRLALRSAYADWWRATQEQALCTDARAAAKDADTTVQERLRGKWILPSDAQLMKSEWTAVLRRCDMQPDLLADTRASLESLGVQLTPDDQPQAAALADHPQPLSAWKDLLESNPRMAQRRADLNLAEANRQRPWYSAIDAYFTVAGSLEDRSGAPENGNGLTAGVTFSAPVDLLDYGSARNRESEARYQAANRSLENERGQLLRELGKVIEQQRRNLNEYAWRSERRTAIDSIIGERRQRGELDSGEASLRLLQAEVDHYNAGFAQISAWHGAWLQESALRLFGDDSTQFAALLGSDALRWQGPNHDIQPGIGGPSAPADWSLGAYIWDSAALLDAGQRDTQLGALQTAQIRQLNVGLNAVQLAAADKTLPALRALLQAAHARQMKVNLLLGDPSWIKASQRPQLIALINQLRGLPFDGLHLDLEVEQLGWPVPDMRVREWLATLREARQASPWPLMISSHPRWFAEQARRNPCVPCELPKIGVQQVSLMIFTRNPQRSSERATAIGKQWPKLNFRLAQSLEPDQPADLSWSDASNAQLQQQSGAWQRQLVPARFGGIDWQSWSYYPKNR